MAAKGRQARADRAHGVEAAPGQPALDAAPKPVRRPDAAATRARLLDAAMREFSAKGMDARIEDIAEMAGANRRMAYYYFGSKEGLYLAALEATYLELVEVEKKIEVDMLDPVEALAALVSAKFEHYARFPRYVEFVRIENQYRARHLKSSERIPSLRGPLLSLINRVLDRGQKLGVFRQDVDPVELYVSICALGYFVFSNQHTLATIFEVDLTSPKALARRRNVIIDMVTAYLRAGAACSEPEPKLVADALPRRPMPADRVRVSPRGRILPER